MDPPLRREALKELRLLADGDWRGARFVRTQPHIYVFKTDVSRRRGAFRMVWDRAVAWRLESFDGDGSGGAYTECVRVWDICSHDDAVGAIADCVRSLKLGRESAVSFVLKPRDGGGSGATDKAHVVPRRFERVAAAAASAAGEGEEGSGELRHTPATEASGEGPLMLRTFTEFSDDVVRSTTPCKPACGRVFGRALVCARRYAHAGPATCERDIMFVDV